MSSTVKLRGKVNFPANVTAEGGFQVVKANGIWTVSPKWDDLTLETTLSDADNQQVWVFNSVTEVYTRMSIQAFLDALPPGPAGDAATIAVGSTSTLAAGASATASNGGSTSAASLVFGIPRGADAGMRYAFESSTSMAAPASGGARLNNATLASVTAMAVNATNSDGVDVSDFVATWDDSDSTVKGYVEVRKEGSGAVLGLYQLTGVTDNTTWLQLALTYVSGSGSFTAADSLYITPYRTGNKGTDGLGTGDVVGPGSATDNAIARFDLTTGKLIQDSVVTIADTTGDIAGTGFVRPGSNDGGALGSATLSYSDLFLASGGVINWNNGDVTVTHSSNALAFAGASSGYSFDAAALPSANDSAALGAAATSWSDLFLASGAVINFANGNFTATHSSGNLLLSGTLSLGTSNAFTCGSIELGAASDTTISRSAAGVIAVEGVPLYSNIPQNSQSAAYTLVLGDAQKHIYHPSADTTARTWTIPANASVAFPIGTAVTFVNDTSGGVITISITSDTLVLAGTGSTGNRSLAANGVATAIKITSTRWIISGTGLT